MSAGVVLSDEGEAERVGVLALVAAVRAAAPALGA
jgi:hypothetical protein